MAKIKEEEKPDNYLDSKIGEYQDEKIKKNLPVIVYVIAGFCFSGLDLIPGMSPFAPAFLSAVPFDNFTAVFLGSSIGYLASSDIKETVRYILCMCFIGLIRLLVHKRIRGADDRIWRIFLALVSVTSASLINQLITNTGVLGFILAFLEGGITLCSSYFFIRTFRTPIGRIGLRNLAMGDKLSIGLSLFVFILCFSGIHIEAFSPARLFCCFCLCLAAYCGGPSAGSIIGVCLGAALSIDPDCRFVFPAFAIGGLISGAFSPLGQIAVAVACSMTFCGCCVIGGIDEEFILPMVESAAASALFMLIPPLWLTKCVEFVQKNGVINDKIVNLEVSSMLQKASANIYSFCKTVDEVSTRLDRVINPEANRLFFEIQQNVCDGCSRKAACWNNDFDDTTRDILTIMGLEKRGKSKLRLEQNCSRLHELKNQLAREKAPYALSMLSKTKNREMRNLFTEQFTGMGDFLGELSEKIAKSRTADSLKSMSLRSMIIDSGVYIDSLNCYCDDGDRTEVEISCFERPFETDYKHIKKILEDTTGLIFDDPEITVTEMGTLLKFEEIPPYCLLAGTAQRPFIKDSPCGDSIAFCKGSDANAAVLLSDGMGTGSSAALDSRVAVSLMEKLLSGGFSFESSVKIVNSSLIMKSTDESMATMDGLRVNLYSGKADFYKAGAAISFIRRDREIFVVEESSLPLGILREVRFAKTDFTLNPGDIVLMVSDGITAGDCGWINDELLSWSTNNMEDLAGHIVELAALRQDKFTGDDLTAVAVKLVTSSKHKTKTYNYS